MKTETTGARIVIKITQSNPDLAILPNCGR